MRSGRLLCCLGLFFLASRLEADPPNVWINEFHYDNTGSDVGEFVEVAAPSSFGELSAVTLTFYNGGDGKKYASSKLSSFSVGTTQDGFTFYYLDRSGIQNGDPDGLCLDYNGTVLQFISYEGDFVAADGPAAGRISVDIGVAENESTPVGFSLQLKGNGTQYNHFAWAGPIAATKGAPNTDQALPVALTSFTGRYDQGVICLTWRVETETDNLGFILDRRVNDGAWERRASFETHPELRGRGTTGRAHTYTFVDDRVEAGFRYEYSLQDCRADGTMGAKVLLSVTAIAETSTTPAEFCLEQNYPNPFNPTTTFAFTLPERLYCRLTVFHLTGALCRVLLEGELEAGRHTVSWYADDLPAGVYFYELFAGGRVDVKTAVLLK
ncbi:MAG: hypothetical protein ONB24_14040 [candidate division KSB1 bacterium]|nr:hypothetical protein [candidate division KSB1 bacterium]